MIAERQSVFSGGMHDSYASDMAANECAMIENGRVDRDGNVQMRAGTQRTNASAMNSGAAGYGIATFTTTAGVEQWIAFFGSKAYKSTNQGSTWTEIASGLTSAYWTFTTFVSGGVGYLVCANGGSTMYSWDGTTWATLTGPTTGIRYVQSSATNCIIERNFSPDGLTLGATSALYANRVAGNESDASRLMRTARNLVVTDVTVTSTTANNAVVTVTVPANAFRSRDIVRVCFAGRVSGTNNVKEIRLVDSNGTLGSISFAAGETGTFAIQGTIKIKGSAASYITLFDQVKGSAITVARTSPTYNLLTNSYALTFEAWLGSASDLIVVESADVFPERVGFLV